MENAARASTRSTHYWTDDETVFMLKLLKDMNILKYMDGRKTRNGKLFKKVAMSMEEGGFPRTVDQIRIRWKFVKKLYFRAKRDNGANGPDRNMIPYYDALDELLRSRVLSQVDDNGVDSCARLPTTMDTTMDPEETETTLLRGSAGSSSPRSTPACTPPPSRTTLPTTITADLPGTRNQQSRRLRDVDVLVHQMQVMNQRWKEDLARSEAREERLIASILQSNERMVEKLMQRLDNIQPQPIPLSPPPQHHHHHQQPPTPSSSSSNQAAEESVELSCKDIDTDMEEEVTEEEEEVTEEEEEEEPEQEEQKSKRKRNDSDDEWAPSI